MSRGTRPRFAFAPYTPRVRASCCGCAGDACPRRDILIRTRFCSAVAGSVGRLSATDDRAVALRPVVGLYYAGPDNQSVTTSSRHTPATAARAHSHRSAPRVSEPDDRPHGTARPATQARLSQLSPSSCAHDVPTRRCRVYGWRMGEVRLVALATF